FTPATGTMTLSGSASVANYQAALQIGRASCREKEQSALARTAVWQANDGAPANNLSNPVTSTINVTHVNDATVRTAGGTLNYTENQVATAIDTTVTVTDVDSPNLAGATIQLTTNYVNGQDVHGFTNQNGITGVFTPATGTMTLSGSASVANYQAAL